MKKLLFLLLFFTISAKLFADEETTPDTVKVGVYIVSVHDIDFRQKQYTMRFWIWMRYKYTNQDYIKDIEVPNAKTMEKSYPFIDSTTTPGEICRLMKVNCIMKEAWKVHNYPFDRQNLVVHIENAQFDRRSLIFIPDKVGALSDPELTVDGWDIDTIHVSARVNTYETNFGDVSLPDQHSEYSSFDINLHMQRNAWGLFFKLFVGMYVAFCIAYLSFFIHTESIETRFGLGVGALFAAVGNKYIIDSILPESSSFTLVDWLHSLTFIFILLILTSCSYTLYLFKRGKTEKAREVDSFAARGAAISFVVINLILIIKAIAGM